MRTAKQLARSVRISPLKARRLAHGIKVRDVAKEVGVDSSYMSMLENGLRVPSLIVARKLAKFYATTVQEIFP